MGSRVVDRRMVRHKEIPLAIDPGSPWVPSGDLSSCEGSLDVRSVPINQPRAVLQASVDNVPRPDLVRPPELLVILLSIDSSELGSEVIHGIERTARLEHPVQLSPICNVGANFVHVAGVPEVAADNLMAAPLELEPQDRSKSPLRTRN